MKQYITFFDSIEDEYINNMVYKCDSEIILETDNFFILKKSNFTLNNNNIIIILFFEKKDNPYKEIFIRGYIYYKNKEYKINNYLRYVSLQIGEFCYDNIRVCYLDKNIFD